MPQQPLSDDPNDLLLQVSLSNRRAFKKLYDITSAKLFAVSLRITKEQALSEEALQDGFLTIWDNARRFDPQKARAITWMGTIVRNKSIDLIRKNSKHSGTAPWDDSVFEAADPGNSPEQLAITHYDLQAVHLCLETLSEAQKNAVLLAYLDGYTHQQIAESQSVPVGSVKTRIYRGVAKLRQCLNTAARGQHE